MKKGERGKMKAERADVISSLCVPLRRPRNLRLTPSLSLSLCLCLYLSVSLRG